jgi:hypothetical protein
MEELEDTGTIIYCLGGPKPNICKSPMIKVTHAIILDASCLICNSWRREKLVAVRVSGLITSATAAGMQSSPSCRIDD